IEDKFSDDLIEALFYDKLTSTKQSAKNKQQKIKNKPMSSRLAFNSAPIGITALTPNQKIQWSLI
ncbi:7268_t:CDS:1, partial [Cetraspora pellucida]